MSSRISIFSFAAFACGFFLLAQPAAAGSKADPAPDWAVTAAKTANPANIKDAPAVVLYDEYLLTIDEQNHAVERRRFAVRILKPQGREYAQCDASYDIDEKLNYFRSWTFTADGRQMQAKETDFTDHGAYEAPTLQLTEKIRVVNPPGGDPGAVVACETEVRMRPYMNEEMWRVQEDIPVVNEAMELALPPGGHFATSWHRTAPAQPQELANNHLRWEIRDMPALDLENVHATPDWVALTARVSIQWGDALVKGTDAQWRAVGLWQSQLEEHRKDPTPEITAKTGELIAGTPDLYTKLSRITDYIQKNVRYFIVEAGIGGWQPHYAGDIYRNRYGDCKDKTTLLIAMLDAAGIRAHSLSVDHRRGFVDPAAPSRFGDHMITAIELPDGESDPRLLALVKASNGKTLLIFDPTDEKTPVGLISTNLQGGWGYLANGSDSQILQIPVLPPESAGHVRKGTFSVAPDGSLTGDITESFTGEDASAWRWSIKESDTKEMHDQIEKTLASDLPGLVFKGYEFSQTADLDKPLALDLHFSAANYAHTAGPLLLLRPRVMGSHAHDVSDVMEGKPRLYPIEIGHPGRWRDSFDIVLPAGYSVDDTPAPVDIDVDFASYHSSVTAKDNLLHYEREYVVRQVEIPAAKAADFRKLERAILSDEKNTAVLKKQ
jgi:hypothetical protein